MIKNTLVTIVVASMIVGCGNSQTVKKEVRPIAVQIKYPKDSNVCTNWDVYKGKKNHGEKYCVGWATVREFKDGRKDTIGWSSGGTIYIGDEYENYTKLSERGKYIVDSLKEDGITQLQDLYLSYEAFYMKNGSKKEQLWKIQGEDIVIYEYLLWNNGRGHGFKLLKKFEVK